MSKGFVYILSNEAMPGLVKIGKTTRSVEQRAHELHQTGVPFPFDVHKSVRSPDCHELEAAVHSLLSDCRVNEQREFFLCDVNKAAIALDECHHEQISILVSEYLPDYTLAENEHFIDPSFPCIMSTHLQMPSADVVDAYGYLMPEDMRAAVKRMSDHRLGVKQMKWLRVAESLGGADK